MTETQIDTVPPSEASVLAGELAGSFARLVRDFEKHFKLSHADAVRMASEADADGGASVLLGPPEQVS